MAGYLFDLKELLVKIKGSYSINAPREQVWAALNDIEVLARIVPGCQQLEQVGENEYEGMLKIGIQAIKGTYQGRIRIEDIQPPQHYRLVASGKSSNGVVDGAGTVDLFEQDGQTRLEYTGDAEIGGMLASVGQRLIDGASRQLINQSLKALTEQITQRMSGGESAAEPAPSEPATPSAPSTAVETPAPEAQPEPARPAPVESAQTAAPVTSPPSPTAQPAESSSQRRTVIVPDHEQLKPETVVIGAIEDFVNKRPWLPWVLIAFLLGIVLGRSRRSG